MTKQNKIIFYFPSKKIGGVQTLFLRFINNIPKPWQVYVVDYKDGFLAKNSISSTHLIEYSNNGKLKLPEGGLLIQQANQLLNPDKSLIIPTNTRMFFWQLHPKNIYAVYPHKLIKYIHNPVLFNLFPSERKYTTNLIKLAINHSAYSVMDRPNANSLSKLVGENDSNLLPLFFDSKSGNIKYEMKDYKTINIVWLGRLELDFKTNILKKIIQDASISEYNIRINIIGDGTGKSDVVEFARVRSCDVKFLGVLEKESLESFLEEEVDISFSMGTSALHTASLGLPTVCLDFSYNKIGGDYRYRWIYQGLDFSLGYDIMSDGIPTENKMNFDDVISDLIIRSDVISKKCYKYVDEKFTLPIDEYIKVISKSSLTQREILKVSSKPKISYVGFIRKLLQWNRKK